MTRETPGTTPAACICGHSPGHHDDEPEGCWECDCEAYERDEGGPSLAPGTEKGGK